MILVISVNIWLTFFLWLSLLSCGYTTFQCFILFKRKKLPSFLNVNSAAGYKSFFLASPQWIRECLLFTPKPRTQALDQLLGLDNSYTFWILAMNLDTYWLNARIAFL